MKIFVCSSDNIKLEDTQNQVAYIDGSTNNHYFIPTRGKNAVNIDLDGIEKLVSEFLVFACGHPEFKFLIAPIACGENEFSPEQIAPMFAHIPGNCLLPHVFSDLIDRKTNLTSQLIVKSLSGWDSKEQLRAIFGHYHTTIEDIIRQHLTFICPRAKYHDLTLMYISNGGMFFKIDSNSAFHLRHPHAVKDIRYSSESASLIANHFVFNSLQQQIDEPWLTDLCDALDTYILSSPQAQQIFLALR